MVQELSRASALAAAPPAADFFDGFSERCIEVPAGAIFCRIGGSGPPLLCLHGYPQTSAMWHKVAPALARHFTVIAPDLRGYGRSVKPPSEPDHASYSKRAMAGDMVELMARLGHARFFILGHDRGGRVAHRLAADRPDAVAALCVLDIAPTREMYAHATSAFAHDYWHWYFLPRPAPFPERLIGADPDYFWLWKCARLGGSVFAREALAEYLDAFADPETIRASCEDYRAAATIDIAHDDADPTRLDMPLLALWGRAGVIERHFDCLALWRQRAREVSGEALPGGHYLAEELPDPVAARVTGFFEAHRTRLG